MQQGSIMLSGTPLHHLNTKRELTNWLRIITMPTKQGGKKAWPPTYDMASLSQESNSSRALNIFYHLKHWSRDSYSIQFTHLCLRFHKQARNLSVQRHKYSSRPARRGIGLAVIHSDSLSAQRGSVSQYRSLVIGE